MTRGEKRFVQQVAEATAAAVLRGLEERGVIPRVAAGAEGDRQGEPSAATSQAAAELWERARAKARASKARRRSARPST
jgi:hypothetical protein